MSGEAAGLSVCNACSVRLATARDRAAQRNLLDAADAPLLLMQASPRQAVTANGQARSLFGKSLTQIEGRRGGEIFDCIHAFTAAGCGVDVHCKECRIKAAVIDAFAGKPSLGVWSPLETMNGMQVSTAPAGEFALVRIDRYRGVAAVARGPR
jgi:hypothetical protein